MDRVPWVQISRKAAEGFVIFICRSCGRVDMAPQSTGFVPERCIYHNEDGSLDIPFVAESVDGKAWNIDPVVSMVD